MVGALGHAHPPSQWCATPYFHLLPKQVICANLAAPPQATLPRTSPTVHDMFGGLFCEPGQGISQIGMDTTPQPLTHHVICPSTFMSGSPGWFRPSPRSGTSKVQDTPFSGRPTHPCHATLLCPGHPMVGTRRRAASHRGHQSPSIGGRQVLPQVPVVEASKHVRVL